MNCKEPRDIHNAVLPSRELSLSADMPGHLETKNAGVEAIYKRQH